MQAVKRNSEYSECDQTTLNQTPREVKHSFRCEIFEKQKNRKQFYLNSLVLEYSFSGVTKIENLQSICLFVRFSMVNA